MDDPSQPLARLTVPDDQVNTTQQLQLKQQLHTLYYVLACS